VTKEVSYYALKKLNMFMDDMQDQGFPITALREIKYLSQLDHDNIVRIRQVIDSKRKFY
jgi:cyclin-dependent kinase 12/13